ncbi:MAG: DUF2203 domain-containing protein [Thermaceae bacterium]
MFPRIYREEDANRLLPELFRILAQMRETKRELEEALRRLPEARGLEKRILEEEIRFLKASLQADLDHLNRLGVLLRDLEKGLVDLPSRLEGQVVFLCVQEGEKEVTHWHALSEDCQNRRPLRTSPFLPATPEAAPGPRVSGRPGPLGTRGGA